MTAEDIYRWLIGGQAKRNFDAFDVHVVASILALAVCEAHAEDKPLRETAGFDGSALLLGMFPDAATLFANGRGCSLARSEDETCLLDLLKRGGAKASPFEALLAAMIARRAQRPNHLWQDLGLRNRDELSLLMTRHFAPLARRNSKDMKWKKFFYRTLCRDADYALCTAPSCGECCDFDLCFNAEAGECLLAHTRKDAHIMA